MSNSTSAVPALRIHGARTHNLRSLNVEIPMGSLTVITGVSGSGKSSLAFDTIFAEGRHRYLSTVSRRSRELLQGIDRPDVDAIEGLPPVLCVEQRLRGVRRRATVATISDIYEYLQLLYSRVGQLYCPTCDQPVAAQSRGAIVQQILSLPERRKIIVLAPIVRSQAGTHADVFARIVKEGFVRARVDGELVDATDPPSLSKSKPHDLEVVVDRLIMKEGIQGRLEESIDVALQLGQGQCVISQEVEARWQDQLFSSRLACSRCGTSFSTLEPRTFSFNSPLGACPACEGLGAITDADGVETDCQSCEGTRLGLISRSVRVAGTSIDQFCRQLPLAAAAIAREWLAAFSPAPDRQRASDGDVDQERPVVSEAQRLAAQQILPEIAARLTFLEDVGLNYVTLDRSGDTLSAGELQRTRLAACLGTDLTGVCYILDEPTAGLGSRDTQRLMKVLFRLRDSGNTVLLVEHDLEVIGAADHVIDIGPGAGSQGGQLLAAGTPAEIVADPRSVTGTFLRVAARRKHEGDVDVGSTARASEVGPPSASILSLRGASLHNLKNTDIDIPLQQIVCVTGVSGSGKTSLVMKTLVPAVRQALGERSISGGHYRELSNWESLKRLLQIDQSPLGRSSRSCPATYSGIWDDVRKVFAKTRESRLRGFTARNFSLSVPEARCPRCAGKGELSVDEHRFADWVVRCPDCDGRRFSPATLSVRYRGRSVADILEMSIAEGLAFFGNLARLAAPLRTMSDLSLGYLKLGQSAATLSGGEAQRVKLATELSKSTGLDGATLFVLDEPTSGLHPADVQQLVRALRKLVEQGHSVLVVEHNAEFIAAADWIIEIGPGAGIDGGQVTFAGRR